MRFALLCDDRSVAPLIDSLTAHVDGHQLTCAARINPQSETLLVGRTGIRHIDHWEDLLTARDVDAVLVGGNDPQILEGAKQLATAGVPLLFSAQADHGSTLIYELSLVHDDNHVALCPAFWHRFDAAVIKLRSLLSEGRLGRIQFLQMTRTMHRPSSTGPIPQSQVDAELLQDADLLRWLIGDYNQVTALQTGTSAEGVLMQNVVLAGRSLPEANWVIKSDGGPGECRLVVRGEQGEAQLIQNLASNTWTCLFEGQQVTGDSKDTARQLIAAATVIIQQQPTRDHETKPREDSEWGQLIKCFETIDAANRSLRRKRTIELHFEPMSERAIFKTQMTAIGCGLLIATFLLSLCFLGLASIVPLPSYVLIALRALVFAPLVLFLIAQVLLPLTRPSAVENS